jgi:myo-inositol catabolism protein IolC
LGNQISDLTLPEAHVPISSPLFILAFDHRQVLRDLFPGRTAEDFTASKMLVLDAISVATEFGRAQGGYLVDEEYGAEAAREAKRRGITLAMPVEASRTPELVHQYGDEFGRHISEFEPDIVKTLIFHSVLDDSARKRRQVELLSKLQAWCRIQNYPIMVEVLIPQMVAESTPYGHGERLFRAMRAAVEELQDRGIQPDIWKLDGLDNPEHTRLMAQQTGAQPVPTRTIVLGSGASLVDVETWVQNAASTRGFEGFAVGRSVWAEPLGRYFRSAQSRDSAVREIADNYLSLVDRYFQAQHAGSGR